MGQLFALVGLLITILKALPKIIKDIEGIIAMFVAIKNAIFKPKEKAKNEASNDPKGSSVSTGSHPVAPSPLCTPDSGQTNGGSTGAVPKPAPVLLPEGGEYIQESGSSGGSPDEVERLAKIDAIMKSKEWQSARHPSYEVPEWLKKYL